MGSGLTGERCRIGLVAVGQFGKDGNELPAPSESRPPEAESSRYHGRVSATTRWAERRWPRGVVAAPHALAAEAGVAILRQGGNAVDAATAAATTVAVVYPHMNGVGGDSFWLKPLLGVRLGRDRRRHRDPLAEPRRVLLAGPRAREPPGAAQADRPHADPVHVSGGWASAPGLRHDGRRGPTADASGAGYAHPRSAPRAAGGGRGAPLALRAHVGRGHRGAAARDARRRRRHRVTASARTRRGGRRGMERPHGPRAGDQNRVRRTDRRLRSARRRRRARLVDLQSWGPRDGPQTPGARSAPASRGAPR